MFCEARWVTMEEVILEQDPKRNRLIDIIEIIVICNVNNGEQRINNQ